MGKMATLGSRDPEHIARWVAALAAGRDAAPRCLAPLRNGCLCQRQRMRGAKRCPVHCKGAERDRVDAEAVARLRREAKWDNAVGRHARNRLENIERRRQNRAWLKDPTIQGRTVVLSLNDERRVKHYLKTTHGIDLDNECSATGFAFTPRAVDRLLWCGVHALSGHADFAAAAKRVECIFEDEKDQMKRVVG
jgi:hypothetical protein